MQAINEQPMLNRPPVQQRARMRPQPKPAVGQAPEQAPQPMQQPQAPPTFAQMQANGQARPAPPAPRAQVPYAGHLNHAIMGALQSPSAYGTPQVMDSYNRLGQSIDDEYTQRERATDEQFAKRGLYDSTAAAGAMHDLNVGRRTAKETLAAQLADQQAQDYAQARQGAISQALQGQQQDVQSALGYGNLDLANRGLDVNVQQGNDARTVQLLQLLAALGINPQGG